MSFLSTETLRKLLPDLIDRYNPDRIKHGAYELSLGDEAFITSSDNQIKIQIDKQLNIPSGQFALLITEELIEIPHNLIAFISDSKTHISHSQMYQGFLLNDGTFLNRIPAAHLVLENGQLEELAWPPNLYSEDLW